MDIILHAGAHRCATTSFQHYLRDQRGGLAARDIGFWGPARTRGGMFSGLFPGPAVARGRNLVRRAEGRVRMNLARTRQNGVQQLIVSDENFAGTMRNAVRAKMLYPAIGERMARINAAFDDQISRVVLSIRAQDLWWASAAAFTVARGHPVPGPLTFEMISTSTRGWRDVITDLACALPRAEIIVTPFEQFAGQPHRLLEVMTDAAAPQDMAQHWHNRTPELPALRKALQEQGTELDFLPRGLGRWQPFDTVQIARLREMYADDMHWLIAGADGLATLANDPTRTQTGISLHAGIQTEGTPHDSRQEQLARSG